MSRLHTLALVVSAVAMVVSLAAAGWAWSHRSSAIAEGATANRVLCAKTDRLDNALIQIVKSSGRKPPRPGDYGYDYYVHHPREARTLRGGHVNDGTLRILRMAACDPANITP